MQWKHALMASSAVLVAMFGAQANAQSRQATNAAAAAAAASNTIEELVVTAEKRAQSLQDVPVVLYTVEPSASRSPGNEDLRDAFDARLVLAIVEAICN